MDFTTTSMMVHEFSPRNMKLVNLSGKFKTVAMLHVSNTLCICCHGLPDMKLQKRKKKEKGRIHQQNNEVLN